jgi:7,8-dihydropterin-6-yl-methyl-4-(beta-D-ribofuranosyl)aminobenzene 5'-phosphate synthase
MTDMVYRIKAITRAEITVLIDNYVDRHLPNQPGVVRPPFAKDGKIVPKTLLAEHGLSLLIDTWEGEKRYRTLLDTGYNAGTVLHNMEMLDIAPESIDTLVLSHGHMDHTGSVNMLLEAIGKAVPVFCHPHVFRSRFVEKPGLGLVEFPRLINREQIIEKGAELHEEAEPTLLSGDTVLVTGQVPRVSLFEKGLPGAKMLTDRGMEPDNIEDDQSLVINVTGCGIAVITGCAHAGIVNSVLYARELTGEKKVCAVIGGFHLTGPDMAPIIDPTVQELKQFAPNMLVPMHCTGFSAIKRFQSEFPKSFVLSSVGTRLILPVQP